MGRRLNWIAPGSVASGLGSEPTLTTMVVTLASVPAIRLTGCRSSVGLRGLRMLGRVRSGLANGSAFAWNANAAGQRFGMGHSDGGFYIFRTASDPGTIASSALYDFKISDTGNVGIGTNTPSAKLQVYEPTNSATSLIETGGGTNSWSQQRFKNANGTWVIGTSRNFDNDSFYIARDGLPLSFFIDSGAFYGGFALADFYLGHPSRRGAPGRALVDFKTGAGVKQLVLNFGNDWTETVIGGSVTEVKTLRITGGADLAEPFLIKEEKLEKGSVVVIDEKHPGRLKRSRKPTTDVSLASSAAPMASTRASLSTRKA